MEYKNFNYTNIMIYAEKELLLNRQTVFSPYLTYIIENFWENFL